MIESSISMATKTLSVEINANVFKKLKDAAKSKGMKLYALVEKLIADGLKV